MPFAASDCSPADASMGFHKSDSGGIWTVDLQRNQVNALDFCVEPKLFDALFCKRCRREEIQQSLEIGGISKDVLEGLSKKDSLDLLFQYLSNSDVAIDTFDRMAKPVRSCLKRHSERWLRSQCYHYGITCPDDATQHDLRLALEIACLRGGRRNFTVPEAVAIFTRNLEFEAWRQVLNVSTPADLLELCPEQFLNHWLKKFKNDSLALIASEDMTLMAANRLRKAAECCGLIHGPSAIPAPEGYHRLLIATTQEGLEKYRQTEAMNQTTEPAPEYLNEEVFVPKVYATQNAAAVRRAKLQVLAQTWNVDVTDSMTTENWEIAGFWNLFVKDRKQPVDGTPKPQGELCISSRRDGGPLLARFILDNMTGMLRFESAADGSGYQSRFVKSSAPGLCFRWVAKVHNIAQPMLDESQKGSMSFSLLGCRASGTIISQRGTIAFIALKGDSEGSTLATESMTDRDWKCFPVRRVTPEWTSCDRDGDVIHVDQ